MKEVYYKNNRTTDEIITKLANDYVSNIAEARKALNNLIMIVFGSIPPLNNPGYVSDEFPVFGTIEERISVNRQLNLKLKELCLENDILFLDVAKHYETNEGDFQWELSDQFCHISSYFQEPGIEMLYTMLAEK
ncbi:MAG: SGNH/GDSL hydrolase family protein [Bacteroidia bacterium]|nr:SGNH/GDSL hydrolase family protein [Bacteroidia bacterium]